MFHVEQCAPKDGLAKAVVRFAFACSTWNINIDRYFQSY